MKTKMVFRETNNKKNYIFINTKSKMSVMKNTSRNCISTKTKKNIKIKNDRFVETKILFKLIKRK